MHNKNNNKTQNYIQGLRPFSTSIPKILKKHLKKGGYNYSNIVENWTKIVSNKISDVCYPITLKMKKDMKNGNLILHVIHGKEIDVEYKKNEIIDKINSFFGFKCISEITLKVMQYKKIKKKNLLPKIKNFDKIVKEMNMVKDEKLKSSLKGFLETYYEKSK
tara:strand:- start:333 stop:818 length:486 start_codon:yes stop_codon:yes gene_type:complete